MLAETKILLGQGDLERWYALLGDPGQLDRLERRVDIAFAPTSRTRYAAGEPVRLDVFVKNVPTLLVKVFAIDALPLSRREGTEVDAGIDLDGVVANFEQTFTYAEPPLRRVLRGFDLPMLAEAGTYVVECVGNGISSRAVIHKGHLRGVERTTAAGHVFRVYDEAGVHLKARLDLVRRPRVRAPTRKGEILLPFSTKPGTPDGRAARGQPLVARDASTTRPRRSGSTLTCTSTASRWSPASKARLVIRPELRLAGRASLAGAARGAGPHPRRDRPGRARRPCRRCATSSSPTAATSCTRSRCPSASPRLRASLSGRVKDLAGKDVDLADARASRSPSTASTQTAATERRASAPLGEGYALEVRGKDGEPKAGPTVCTLRLRHRDYRDPIEASLQTDAAGRIAARRARGHRARPRPPVERVRRHVRDRGRAVPARPPSCTASRGRRCAFRTRAPRRRPPAPSSRCSGRERDAFGRLALADGFLELRGLGRATTSSRCTSPACTIAVRITAGRARRCVAASAATASLEAARRRRCTCGRSRSKATSSSSRSRTPSPGTRVHVVRDALPAAVRRRSATCSPRAGAAAASRRDRPAESSYHSGRELGDEYRYVLERRFATKFPGNMLRRPSLLLNPWALEDESKNAADVGRRRLPEAGRAAAAAAAAARPTAAAPGGPARARSPARFANLDFLPAASRAAREPASPTRTASCA